MAYTRDQLDTKAERNQVNEAMRASSEWRSAIQAMGLNPDGPLKLSKTQQRQLGQRLGLPLDDFHIDPAGNINDFHGWKGLPTWAKVAIVSGVAVGTAGAGGMFSGAPGAFGVGTGASSAAATAPLSTAVPLATQAGGVTGGILPGAVAAPGLTVAGGTIATAAPVAAAAPTVGALAMDPLTLALTGGSMIANYFGARSASKASKDAAKLQAESADKALAFQQRMWEDTQRNQAPWLQAGTGAINTMANLGGIPMMAPGSTSNTPPATAPLASVAPPASSRPLSGGAVGTAAGQVLGQMPMSAAVPRPGGMGAPAMTGNFVTLQAPDGSTQRVPQQFASAFEARGARRIG